MAIRETSYDRRREQAIAARLQSSLGWLLTKMPPMHVVDYAIDADGGGGAVAGFVEIKSRNGCWGDYPTVVFNLRKLLTM